MPYVATIFVFAMSNSELKYFTILTHFFTISFKILLFKIYFIFLRSRLREAYIKYTWGV